MKNWKPPDRYIQHSVGSLRYVSGASCLAKYKGEIINLKTRKDFMNETQNTHDNCSGADLREQIVFQQSYDPKNYQNGGIRKFKCISLDAIKKLLDGRFISPDSYMNNSPTARQFVSFVETHNPDNWFFHGYVVSPNRDDTRVTIEGIGSNTALGKDDLIDFLLLFRLADELDAERNETVYCWYD